MPHLRAKTHIAVPRGIGYSSLSESWNGIRFFLALGLLFSLVFASPASSFAREVRVQEVTISLHNKAVTGFKVRLDRNTRIVTEQVLEHVARQTSGNPFQYDNTIIYENVRYRPVSVTRDLSLYFMLKNLQDQLTELTVVAMYDYHRSINSRDFPSLSLLLQADIARLVRRTTGDFLRSESILFDDPTLSDLAPLLDNPDSPPVVEHFREEEVENQGVIMHGDPFGVNPDKPAANRKVAAVPEIASSNAPSGNPEIDRLRARVRELEQREQSLLDEAKRLRGDQVLLERKQEQILAKLGSTKHLQDSIKILNRRIEDMLGYYYVSDDFSVSNETAAEMQGMEKRLQVSQGQIAYLREQLDSIQARNLELQGLLATTGTSARQRARDMRDLERENKDLSRKNGDLQEELLAIRSRSGNSASAADSLISALGQQRAREADLVAEIKDLKQNEERLRQDYDRSAMRGVALEERIKTLEAENRNLGKELVGLRSQIGQPVAESPELRDSLRLMGQRLAVLEASAARSANQSEAFDRQSKALAQKTQEASSYQADLAKTKRELEALRNRSGDAESRYAALQTERDDLAEQLDRVNALQGQTARDKERLERQGDQLQADLNATNERLTALDDVLSSLSSRSSALEQQLKVEKARYGLSVDARDSLQRTLNATIDARGLLEIEVQELTMRIDSLEAAIPPSDDAGNFIREQWSRLQTWEKELNARNAKVNSREKLIDQRSVFLAEREAEIAEREAQLSNLEEREAQLKLLEARQLTVPTGKPIEKASSFSVKEGKVVEFGIQVPVYGVETSLKTEEAQKRIAAYFISRGEIVDQQFPDFLFKTVQFIEFDDEPLDIRVRIDSRASGSSVQVSYELPGGQFIGPNSSKQLQNAATKLVEEMLQYNF